MMRKNFSTFATARLLMLLFCAILVLQACKKSRSDIGKVFFQETRNKIFKEVEADAFAGVFKTVLQKQANSLKNPKLITSFYEKNDYDPVLMMRHLPKEHLKVLADHLNKAGVHGLSPEVFDAPRLNELLKKVYDKDAVRSKDEAYRIIAELEISTANSLISYSNALQ